ISGRPASILFCTKRAGFSIARWRCVSNDRGTGAVCHRSLAMTGAGADTRRLTACSRPMLQDDPDRTIVRAPPARAQPLAPLPRARTAIALPAGHRLHEYRIDTVLGQGGFGITYLATDVHLHAPVAIKEYLPEDI